MNASYMTKLAARCHVVYPVLSLAINSFFFNSFAFRCACSAQNHNASNIPTWYSCAAMCKAVRRCSLWASNNSCAFSYASLAQFHNAFNACNLPNSAALCHAIYPYMSLASNNFFLTHLDSVALFRPKHTISLILVYVVYL